MYPDLRFASLSISSKALNSNMTRAGTTAVYHSLLDPAACPKILFVTPERVAKSKLLLSRLQKVHEERRLELLVVDECHCCSQVRTSLSAYCVIMAVADTSCHSGDMISALTTSP